MKAVLHVMKIRSSGDARRLAGHNNRSKPPRNADSARSVQWLLPNQELDSDPWNRIESRVSKLPNARIRKNSVKAVSMVLSASPEYFGEWTESDEKTKAWLNASMGWLRHEFGDLVVGCWVHFDEKTPHLHIHIVPGTVDGRLSAKERFGPRALSRYQTEYARAVNHLGIERGIPGSRAVHQPTRKWYADRENDPKALTISTPPLLVKETSRRSWAKKQNRGLIEHQKGLIDKTQGRRLAEKRSKEMAETAEAKERELVRLRQERNQLRDIDLASVLNQTGWERDPEDLDQWLHPAGSAAGRISIKGQKWFDHSKSKGAGGAIDLTMHLHQFGLKDAVGWLRDEFGTSAATGAYNAAAARTAGNFVELAPTPYRKPKPAPEAVGALEQWLIKMRGLRSELARGLIQQGAVFASWSGKWLNAVWPFAGGNGAEIKGINGDFKGNAAGSRPGVDFWKHETGPNPSRLVIAESPLDAVSFHQLHPGPESTLVSTAGAKSKPPDGLKKLAQAHASVVVAYDNDQVGNHAGKALARSLRGEYKPPDSGKDWNQQLQPQQPASEIDPLDDLDSISKAPDL